MKTFMQWAEEEKVELPFIDTEHTSKEKTTKENSVRTGQTQNYPDAYVRSQYPLAWFVPTKATAYLDAQNKPRKVAN